jgi:ComF family protein
MVAARIPTFLSAVGDWFYPPRCLACGAGLWLNYAAFLCPDCENNLAFIGAEACRFCGAVPSPGIFAPQNCRRCATHSLSFTRALAVVRYHFGGAKALVHHLKYYGNRRLAPPLGTLLATRVEKLHLEQKISAIAAVPLHPSREYMRGYNQSFLLAQAVAAHLHLPLLTGLHRRRDTPPQALLARAHRYRNVQGAFTCEENLTGAAVLLIDDVITTGVTMSECAKALRAAGAPHIYAAAFAS